LAPSTSVPQVVWFVSAEEEAAFWWAMNDQYRASVGPGSVTVVDVRTSATSASGACGTAVAPAAC
jgi:hypothetical protein